MVESQTLGLLYIARKLITCIITTNTNDSKNLTRSLQTLLYSYIKK